MSSAKPITDHDEIRAWAEERGGKPARVIGTGGDDDLPQRPASRSRRDTPRRPRAD